VASHRPLGIAPGLVAGGLQFGNPILERRIAHVDRIIEPSKLGFGLSRAALQIGDMKPPLIHPATQQHITMRFALPLTTFAPVKTGALPKQVGQRAGDQIATNAPPFWESPLEGLEGDAINGAQWDSAHVFASSEGRRIGEAFDFSMLRGAALLPGSCGSWLRTDRSPVP